MATHVCKPMLRSEPATPPSPSAHAPRRCCLGACGWLFLARIASSLCHRQDAAHTLVSKPGRIKQRNWKHLPKRRGHPACCSQVARSHTTCTHECPTFDTSSIDRGTASKKHCPHALTTQAVIASLLLPAKPDWFAGFEVCKNN